MNETKAVTVVLTALRQAEEIPQALAELRSVYSTGASAYLVLRSFGGIQLNAPEDPDAQLPSPIPGVLIESARFIEHDGYASVEITVWGSMGEMELLIASQSTHVDVYQVEDAR